MPSDGEHLHAGRNVGLSLPRFFVFDVLFHFFLTLIIIKIITWYVVVYMYRSPLVLKTLCCRWHGVAGGLHAIIGLQPGVKNILLLHWHDFLGGFYKLVFTLHFLPYPIPVAFGLVFASF